ncbi:MAG: hypothetical protein U0U46_10250 [Saprospiraceae bacterium]
MQRRVGKVHEPVVVFFQYDRFQAILPGSVLDFFPGIVFGQILRRAEVFFSGLMASDKCNTRQGEQNKGDFHCFWCRLIVIQIADRSDESQSDFAGHPNRSSIRPALSTANGLFRHFKVVLLQRL